MWDMNTDFTSCCGFVLYCNSANRVYKYVTTCVDTGSHAWQKAIPQWEQQAGQPLKHVLKDKNVTWNLNFLELEKVSNMELFYQRPWIKVNYEQMPNFFLLKHWFHLYTIYLISMFVSQIHFEHLPHENFISTAATLACNKQLLLLLLQF